MGEIERRTCDGVVLGCSHALQKQDDTMAFIMKEVGVEVFGYATDTDIFAVCKELHLFANKLIPYVLHRVTLSSRSPLSLLATNILIRPRYVNMIKLDPGTKRQHKDKLGMI